MKDFAKRFGPFVTLVLAILGITVGGPKIKTFGAPGIAPVINPNWNVLHWFIDEAGTATACASDNNSGTSGTCGAAGSGIGPFRTWHQLNDVRWGCLGSPNGCPRMTDGLTHDVTDLSNASGPGDPRYVYPALENGSSLVFKASLPTPAISGNFTSIVNWQSSCTSPRVTDSGNTIGTSGAMIRDTGAHGTGTTAVMWCDEFSAVHNCQNTIPMTAVTVPPSAFQTPGLWTTATGGANGASGLGATDAYSLYTNLIEVDFVALEPIVADWVGSPPTNGVFVYDEQIFDPGGVGVNAVRWGPGVTGYEVRSDRTVNLLPGVSNKDEGCVNCWANGKIIGGRMSTGNFWHFNGGELTSITPGSNMTGNGVAFDGYALIEDPGFAAIQGVTLGLVKNDSAGSMTLAGYNTLTAVSPGYSTVNNGVSLCGTGFTLNLLAGTFAYDSSHGGSAGVLPGSNTYEIAGSVVAESHSGVGTVTVTNGITISTTTLDTAASSTNFGGFAYGNGGIIRKM